MSDVVFKKVRGTSWLGPSFGKVLFWINLGLQVGVEEKKKGKKWYKGGAGGDGFDCRVYILTTVSPTVIALNPVHSALLRRITCPEREKKKKG